MRGLRLVTTEGEEGTRGEKVGGGGQERESSKMIRFMRKRAFSTRHGSILNTSLNLKLFAQPPVTQRVKKR